MRTSSLFTLIAAALAFFAVCRAEHSTDLFWQIPEGRSVLHGTIPRDVPWAVGDPAWLDHEWLFEALAAWCYDHRLFVVLVLLCALAAAAAPLLAYAAARDLGYDWASTSFAVLLVCASTSVSWAERPQNFVLLLFLAQLWLLWRGARAWWALLPLAAAWSNLHASGVLAPLLCVAFALAYAIAAGARDGRVRASLAAATAAFAGTFLTPHGLGLWRYALDAMADRNHSHRYIVEWLPLFSHDVLKAGLIWLLVVMVIAAAALVQRRAEIAPTLIGLGFLALPVLHARFVLFTAAAAMPLVARSVRTITDALPEAREARYPRALLVVPLLIAAVGIRLAATGPGLGSEPVYADARTLVARHAVAGPIFAEYTADAYLAAFAALPVRVIVDSHADPFDAKAWDDEAVLERALPRWDGVLRRRGIEHVVLPATHPLVAVLELSPRWTLLDRTPNVRLFAVRR